MVALVDFLATVDEPQRSVDQLQKVAQALMVQRVPIVPDVVCACPCLCKREENQIESTIDLIGFEFNDLVLGEFGSHLMQLLCCFVCVCLVRWTRLLRWPEGVRETSHQQS